MQTVTVEMTDSLQEWLEEVVWLYGVKVIAKDDESWIIEGEPDDIRMLMTDIELVLNGE